jgi:F-type H+-transporting ATPase subunit delta
MIADRYAKALFNLAKEEGDYRKAGKDLQTFLAIFEGVKELRSLLLNPSFSFEGKRKILKGVDQFKNLSPMAQNFILFLIKKGRLSLFSEICEFYESLLDTAEGRLRAEVRLAVKTGDEVIQKMKSKLEEITGKKVVLSVHLDQSLIGGVVVKSGDLIFDGSIKTQLEKIEDRLKEGVV